MRKLAVILIFLWSHALMAQCDLNGILLELQATTTLDGILVGDGSCISVATILPPLSFSGDTISLTTGNLTAGSSKVSIGGTGTNALLGPGASIDVVPANILLSTLGGSLNLSQLSTTGASNGQVIEFNGTAWVPGADDSGSGTVTSVGLSLPTAIFDVTGSPVTTSGTLTATFDNQTANTVFAGPTSGGAATPAFRALVAADLPAGTNLWTDAGSFTYLTSTSDRVVIGNALEVDPNYKLQVKNGLYSLGAGSTSSTYSAQFHNSTGGNNALVIRDDTRVGVATATPARTFHNEGETRLVDLTTDDPTRIVGADADGDLGAITVGSGLSLTSGTLTATAGATDLSFTGASSPVTLNSSTGTDVSFTAGGINSFSATGTNITITATEVDGSTTNEAWTIDGDDADTEVISNQTVKFQGAGIATTDYNPTTDVLLITATEVDGSTSNELQTLASTSDATSHTVTLSNSGGSIKLIEGSNITLTTGGTGLDGEVTIASTGGGGNYQTWRDDGVAATQRANANFVSTATVGFTLTDDAGNTETEVTANVPDDAITYAKLQNVSSGIILGRDDAGSGNVEELSPDVTLVLNGTGNLGRAALTGDVTAAAGSNATTIANDAVTYAKMQNAVANNVLLGNNNGAGTNFEELDAAAVQTLLSYIDGAGAANRIAYWTDANTLDDDAAYTVDAANDRMTITGTLAGTGANNAWLNVNGGSITGIAEAIRVSANLSTSLDVVVANARNTGSTGNTRLELEVGGTSAGDPFIIWSIPSGTDYIMGVDNSDADKLKITPGGTTPGSTANKGVTITTDAATRVGINKDGPLHPLDIAGIAMSAQWRNTGNLYTSANVTFGTGAGTGPTVNSISGGNNWLQITFTTGTTPTANGDILTLTYPNAYGTLSYPVFSARNSAQTATDITKFYISSGGAASFTLKANGTLNASELYSLSFSTGGY